MMALATSSSLEFLAAGVATQRVEGRVRAHLVPLGEDTLGLSNCPMARNGVLRSSGERGAFSGGASLENADCDHVSECLG